MRQILVILAIGRTALGRDATGLARLPRTPLRRLALQLRRQDLLTWEKAQHIADLAAERCVSKVLDEDKA
jgi:hypothetical protein